MNTLKTLALIGASALGGMIWYEYVMQENCKKGYMYRSLKKPDGSYSVYGSTDAISPEDRDKIYTAQAGASDE